MLLILLWVGIQNGSNIFIFRVAESYEKGCSFNVCKMYFCKLKNVENI